VIVSDRETYSNPSNELESRILMYRLSERRFPFQKITISEKELNQLLESINEFQDKYKDLLNLIEEDPDLKRYIEKKLEENKRKNVKL
jgi:parvulin-like peptidyl-prolyl isomerase